MHALYLLDLFFGDAYRPANKSKWMFPLTLDHKSIALCSIMFE